MRQLTIVSEDELAILFSKLPMRQLTRQLFPKRKQFVSKLPMRQLTAIRSGSSVRIRF